MRPSIFRLFVFGATLNWAGSYVAAAPAGWTLGDPIVTYYAGPGYPGSPPLNDASAKQMSEGGWNLVWCGEKELDIAQRHGLRGQLTDPLLNPTTLDDPKKKEALDALIARVRTHPALYSYYCVDEPSAQDFPAWGRLVAYLRNADPTHLAYLNLFPTYATNQQLGTPGDKIAAYQGYLDLFLAQVKPELLSYDHYQFTATTDISDYFLNLAIVRRTALDAKVPFLNVVQACKWGTDMRAPNQSEMRYLVYTTLAYGAQGISYFVYTAPGFTPGIADEDGRPTPVYWWLKALNRDFSAIRGQLGTLYSLGVYHAGAIPPGGVAFLKNYPFTFSPAISDTVLESGQNVKGALLGTFGKAGTSPRGASHFIVVNLNYISPLKIRLRGPSMLEVFDPLSGRWSSLKGNHAEMELLPGDGRLLRVIGR